MTSSIAPTTAPASLRGWKRGLLLLVVICPWWWLFGPSLIGSQTAAFRDAAHFYFPTFSWANQQWQQGEIPLWNPQDNLGTPVMQDLSSSLLYPGKLLFLFPCSFPRLYNCYIALHVLLAALGTYQLARHWQASTWGALLAAVSYAFSGSLLSQHANVIYLVGAAWIPFAFKWTDLMLVQRNWSRCLGLAACLALMTTGGDPQSAYHVGFLAGLYALILSTRRPAFQQFPRTAWHQHRLALLVMAGVFTFLLSAVQVLPTIAWTHGSLRRSHETPRNLYETLPSLLTANNSSGETSPITHLLQTPAQGTHHRQIYDFSVGPWRLAELLWPNFSGKMYPVHRRWINQVPAEGRVWAATLYLGWLPFLLGCAAWNLRSPRHHVRWLSYLVMIGILASLGWYGIGWLTQEIRLAWGGNPADPAFPGEPVGGLYWFLVQILPGYVQFRYPGKWFVIASLAFSLLAGQQLDVVHRQGLSPRWRFLACMITLASGLMLGILLIFRDPVGRWLSTTPAHSYWGPLDSTMAFRDLACGLVHTMLISLACYWMLRKPLSMQPRWLMPLAICITTLEILVANGWLVIFSPDHQWNASTSLASQLQDPGTLDRPPTRIFRAPASRLIPDQWKNRSSLMRHEHIVYWDRNTFFPRHHLLGSPALVRSPGSIEARDYHAAWAMADQHAPRPGRPPLPFLQLLGVEHVLLPGKSANMPLSSSPIHAESVPAPLDRAWITHELIHFQPLGKTREETLEQRTQRVFLADGKFRDFRHTTVVESTEDPRIGIQAGHLPDESEQCRIVEYRPTRVCLEVTLQRPGMVVLSDHYTPGWRATVAQQHEGYHGDAEPYPVYRVNRIMRGTFLPAGNYRITYHYRPPGFYLGAIISLISISLFCLLHFRRWRHTIAGPPNTL